MTNLFLIICRHSFITSSFSELERGCLFFMKPLFKLIFIVFSLNLGIKPVLQRLELNRLLFLLISPCIKGR